MTLHLPTIETDRLLLRPFQISDSSQVMALAGDRLVYETTFNIPHPYEAGVAEKWIASLASQFHEEKGVTFAITIKRDLVLIGAIGLGATSRHRRAELGYWIGVPYWNQGYCSEAASAVINFGFSELGYHKITSRHMINNPASGRVMEKAGMMLEGVLVDELFKDGQFHTLKVYGILNSDQADGTSVVKERMA